MSLDEPLKIGSITADPGLLLAPMEDVSDLPFRTICKEMGADIVYTEFTNCEALSRNVKRSLEKIRVTDEERPVAIQLYGSNGESLERATKIAEEFGPDFIDINCGCWVKKVANRGGAPPDRPFHAVFAQQDTCPGDFY